MSTLREWLISHKISGTNQELSGWVVSELGKLKLSPTKISELFTLKVEKVKKWVFKSTGMPAYDFLRIGLYFNFIELCDNEKLPAETGDLPLFSTWVENLSQLTRPCREKCMPTLHWFSREKDLKKSGRGPYRLLEHVADYGESQTKNMIIHGDNLDVLKALLPYYVSKVKCIYIDPPYKTSNALKDCDDNFVHSQWLSVMYPRLKLLRELLSEDGGIWAALDNSKAHYFKVICDEIFGRNNFIANVIWQKGHYDHIFCYAKHAPNFKMSSLERNQGQKYKFKNPDNDLRGPWKAENLSEIFDTPKPECLLSHILNLATNPGDLVLDSFLGSGTIAAVAHKMGRKYIGIKSDKHAEAHHIPRLQKVIAGEQGGISKIVDWQGGGGFRFYRLGGPVFNNEGQITDNISFTQLAAHIWFFETETPWQAPVATSPMLGIYADVAYYLLFNGIIKEKSSSGGNVLTSKTLDSLPPHAGPKVIYGERCLFSLLRLKTMNIVFKHTPHDIKGR